jgi:hypothetical protein
MSRLANSDLTAILITMRILRVNRGNVKRMKPRGELEKLMTRGFEGVFTRRASIRLMKKTKRNEASFSGDEVGKVQEKM